MRFPREIIQQQKYHSVHYTLQSNIFILKQNSYQHKFMMFIQKQQTNKQRRGATNRKMQLDMKPPVTSGSYLKRCIFKFRQKRTNTRQGQEQTKQEKRKDPRIERINDCTMKRERSLDQLFFCLSQNRNAICWETSHSSHRESISLTLTRG